MKAMSEAQRGADHDPAGRRQRERGQAAAPTGRRADRRGQRHLVGGQRGRVVEQALAAEQRHDPARQPEPPADRRRRHRVGRRDDRAEGQRRRERQLRARCCTRRSRPRTSSPAAGRRRAARSGEGCSSARRSCSPGRPTTATAAAARTARGSGSSSISVKPGNRARRQAGDHQRQGRGHVEAAGHRGQQDRHHQHREQGAMHFAKPPGSVDVPILGQHAEEITRTRFERLGVADDLRASRRGCDAEPEPAHARAMPGMRRTGREHLGTSANVPDLRARRLLRFQPAPARQRTLPTDRPPRHAIGRAGRELAVVLHRRPGRLTIWQA